MSIKTELDAILRSCAIAPLNDRAFLRVTGSDATRWLNGMVTNSVQALAPGEGCYNFLLNAQGRILGDCTIYREPNPAEPASFLLETGNSQLETVRQHLDHFIIMDDVELTPGLRLQDGAASIEHPIGIAVLSKDAPLLVWNEVWDQNEIPFVTTSEPRPGTMTFGTSGGYPVVVLSHTDSSTPYFELWVSSAEELERLRSWPRFREAIEVSAETLEALRLLEARPLYGRDITERYLPQETNQPQALHFNKGCYLGQEIVERIRSRGQVHRLLTPLTLTGELPTQLPTPIEADGKPAGEITSAAVVPLPEGDQILALGYVRREALDTHAALTYSGGTASPRAASKELPTTNP
jgi:folate-binding protein YgfZ